ncbi:MYB binding protein 1a [Rhynchophorus ferrugineus]|uniref:MYB binding protein 1a n=1 Tax=Rhynchophorus ferrugineus TaxID=354439 RepID=UPI003FCDFD97
MEVMEPESVQNNEEISKKKVGKTVLDNFSKLGHQQENVRLKSASNLLRYISDSYDKEKNIDEYKYALKRLIRGVGASSVHSKTGYYCALVALLNLNVDTNVEDILELISTELHKSGKNSDSENANICTGQILCCGALIKSNIWKQCNKESQKKILELLISASKERSYLTLVGFSYIVELLDQVSQKQFEKIILPSIQTEIAKPWNVQTLDSIYLIIHLRKKFPTIFNKPFFKEHFGSPELFCLESLTNLSNVLMTVPRVTYIKHPIYNCVIKEISAKLLKPFFEALDNHLKAPNRNRLFIFIKILTNTFLNLDDKNEEYLMELPHIFSNNFISQMLGYFRILNKKQKDKEYFDNVRQLFDVMVAAMQTEKLNSDIKLRIMEKFLFDAGTFIFEKVTKSKVIQQIISTLDPEGVKNLATVYRNVIDGSERINSENDSEKWINNDRLYCVHLLIKLLNLPCMKEDNQWKVDQLHFLLELAFLKEKSASVGRELAESIKTAFYGALDLKLSKLEDLQYILSQLVHRVNSKISSDNLDNIFRTPVEAETYVLWEKTLNIVDKIEKKKKRSKVSSVYLTLFLHMSLQLFNDVKLATDSLNELFLCYDKVKNKKDNLDVTVVTSQSTEGELNWIEVVTDLFLNLLSHNSHLLRTIIKCVFPHLCPYMTTTTINQILSVLDPQNENPLSKGNESSDESEDEDETEADEDDDDNAASDSGEESNEESDPEETVNDKLRMALHQALSKDTGSDDESIDLDQMSDTEAEKLDKALADVFRQFRPNRGNRKKQSKDQELLTHFRVRVLDLVEIYLDSTPSMHLALEIMLPLLQSFEFSIRDQHQRPMNDRLKGILKKLLALKKFSDLEGVTGVVLVDLLKSLLDKGSKNALIMQDMEQQLADCCIFVVKCSDILCNQEGVDKKTKKLKSDILEVLSGEILQFFTKRDCLTPYVLFKQLLQTTWEGNVGLAVILLDFLFDDEIRQFKKNQVAELLSIFYSNHRLLSQNMDSIQSKMSETHEEFAEKIINFFRTLCEQPENKTIKERFICLLFNCLISLKNSPLKIELNWPEIAETIREYRSYKSFSTDAKTAFNKLCRTLGVSNIVKMKNNVTKLAKIIEADDEGEKNAVKENGETKKKKRHNKEKLKLKKETKQLRLASLGVELNGAFNHENMDVENEEDNVDIPQESITEIHEENGGDTQQEPSPRPKDKKKRMSLASIPNGHNNLGDLNKKRRHSEGESLIKKRRKSII